MWIQSSLKEIKYLFTFIFSLYNTRFLLPTLLYVGYSVKLIFIVTKVINIYSNNTWSPRLLSQKVSRPILSPDTTTLSDKTARHHTIVSLPLRLTDILQVACPVSTFHILMVSTEPKENIIFFLASHHNLHITDQVEGP